MPPSVRKHRWWAIAAGTLVLLPLALTAVRMLFADHGPLNSDVALIELRTRDVGTSYTPLVGSYQRFGFNMPGPWLFYTLAPVYRLLGADFAAAQIGAVLVAGSSIVAITWIAWRRGGAVLLTITLTVIAWYVRGVGPARYADPWEPHVVVLPLVLLVFVVWDVAAGNDRSLPLMAVVATWVGLVYMSVLGVAGVLGAFGLAVYVARAVRARRSSRALASSDASGNSETPTAAPPRPWWRWPLVLAVGLGVVMVMPPLYEELRTDPGNLTLTWRYVTGGEPVLGLADGWRSLAFQLDAPSLWLGRDVPVELFTPFIELTQSPALPLGLLVLVVGTALAAWRRSDRAPLWLAATVWVGIGAFAFALSRVTGELFPWIVLPSRAMGIVVWIAGAWCVWSAVPGGWRARAERPVVALLAVVLVVGAAAGASRALRDDPEPTPVSLMVRDLAGVAADVVDPDEVVLVRSEAGANVLFATDDGVGSAELGLELVRRGYEVVVDPAAGNRFGPERAEPDRATVELRLVDAPAGYRPPAGYELIGVADVLTPQERRIREEFEAFVDAQGDLEAFAERVRTDPELRRQLAPAQEIEDIDPIGLIRRSIG